MPDYKTHILIGFGSMVIILVLISLILSILHINPIIFCSRFDKYLFYPEISFSCFQNIIILFIIVGIYSILPDLDIKTSKIFNLILSIGLISIIILSYFTYIIYSILIAVVLLLISTMKHRGHMHSIFFMIIFSIPLLYLGIYVAIIGAIAYLSHLFADDEVKLI
ncbi:MAG: metal-dependent hydrolase [Candidatus Aenigmarchaeota archaeon]|nr:metal-dependent hydrolase [Candidatus Aenigmarchaeota archaeon]